MLRRVVVLVLIVAFVGACATTSRSSTSGATTTTIVLSTPATSASTTSTSTSINQPTDTTPVPPPTTAAEEPTVEEPTLGRAWPGGRSRGFGEVRPSQIDNGGDPTGLVTDVTWSSWGDAQAQGTGITTYVAPDQIVADGQPEPVTIVAFDLTVCDGHSAYRHVAYFFPSHGESFDPETNGETQYDICTGP